MVQKKRFELSRDCSHCRLKTACLPFHHLRVCSNNIQHIPSFVNPFFQFFVKNFNFLCHGVFRTICLSRAVSTARKKTEISSQFSQPSITGSLITSICTFAYSFFTASASAMPLENADALPAAIPLLKASA